jgi:hypothetical protein
MEGSERTAREIELEQEIYALLNREWDLHDQLKNVRLTERSPEERNKVIIDCTDKLRVLILSRRKLLIELLRIEEERGVIYNDWHARNARIKEILSNFVRA